MTEKTGSERLYRRLSALLLALFALFALYRGFCDTQWYAEIDSNVLPVEALEYRGTLLINETDIAHAREDFPVQYEGIEHYDDLHSIKLVKITEETWMAYYFPAYPLLCMPFKLLFQRIGISQIKAFTAMNALLLIAALWIVRRYLPCSERGRLFAVAALACSPCIYYVSYINYEIYMCSLVTVSLVMHLSGHRRLGALCLALAGMSNSTVMAVGFIYIAEYFIDLFRGERGERFWHIVRKRFWETMFYGAMYLPCFAPFVFQRLAAGASVFSVDSTSFSYYGERVLSYWFDPTVGFFTFAPLMILFLLAGTVVSLCRREWRRAALILYPIAAICSVSLMFHINCALIVCARYLIWIYPAVVLPAAMHLAECRKETAAVLLGGTILAASAGLLVWNHPSAGYWQYFNNSTRYLLHAAPEIYNPHYALFYCRNEHDMSGGYWNTHPSYYEDELDDGCVRKILYKADEGAALEVMEGLRGDEQSLNWVSEHLERQESDGEFHYVSIPLRSGCRVWARDSVTQGEE